MKTCSKCGETKPLEAFNKSCSRRDCLQPECKACNAAYRTANKEKIRAYYVDNKEEITAKQRAYYAANPEKMAARRAAYRATLRGWAVSAYNAAKKRAEERNVPCTITVEWLIEKRLLSVYCRMFGWEMQYGRGKFCDQSATLDCINPAEGYVPGNVIIVSRLANSIKTNATVEQIRAVADFYEKLVPVSEAILAANSVSEGDTK